MFVMIENHDRRNPSASRARPSSAARSPAWTTSSVACGVLFCHSNVSRCGAAASGAQAWMYPTTNPHKRGQRHSQNREVHA